MLMLFQKYRPYLIVFGGFLMQIPIGVYYSSGDIQSDLITYMQNRSLSGQSVTPGNAIWIFGLLAFGMGTSVSVGGYMENKIGPALTTLIGGWLMSLNVCLTYFTINSYLSVVILSYGLCAGIGAGIVYGVSFGVACKWFPNNGGLVIGIVVSGLGISQTIFIALEKWLFSFRGDSILDDLPIIFVYLGCSYAVLQLFGALLLRLHTDPWKLDSVQSISDVYPNLFSTTSRQPNSPHDLKPHQLFLEFDFWILWLTYVLNTSSIPIIAALSTEFGRTLNLEDMNAKASTFGRLAIANMIGGFFNFSGRIFFGFIIDRKPYKRTMLILTLTNSVLMGTFLLLYYAQNIKCCIYLFIFWVSALNFFQGGNFSVIPLTCLKLFGLRNFVSNYGILFTANSISGALVSMLVTVSDSMTIHIFIAAFLTGCVMSFLAAGLTLLFRGRSLIMYKY